MKSLNIAGFFLFIIGAITIVSKSFTPEYIDSQGILHEWFILLPVGFGAIFIALCIFLVSSIVSISKKFKINKM